MYCNHCGANNPDGATYCNACGKPISATGNPQSIKIDAANGHSKLQARSQWCDFLHRFRNHVLPVSDGYGEIGSICNMLDSLQSQKSELTYGLENDRRFDSCIGYIAVATVAIVLFSIATNNQSNAFSLVICLVLLFLLPALLILSFMLHRRKKSRKKIALLDENITLLIKKANKEKLKLQINFENFTENKAHGMYIVGFEYASPWMLEALENVIRNGKADTPKDAIACYETERERQRSQQDRARNALFQQSLLIQMDSINDQMDYLNSIATANFVLNAARL